MSTDRPGSGLPSRRQARRAEASASAHAEPTGRGRPAPSISGRSQLDPSPPAQHPTAPLPTAQHPTAQRPTARQPAAQPRRRDGRRTLDHAPVTFDGGDQGGRPSTGSGAVGDASAAGPSGRRSRRNGREPTGRAGRNLPAAIGVGVVLAAAVLGSLLFRKEIFVGLVSAAVVLAVWELVGAFASHRVQAPVIPLVVGSLGMLVSAYVGREQALLVAFGTTAFGILLWRLVDGLDGALRDISAGLFISAYVPFMAGFAIVMLSEPDGAMRVLVFIAAVVASDVGGFAAGVLFGRHPMAPSVSPKKSWEGFAGSAVVSMIMSSVAVATLLGGPWWAGPAIGASSALTGTLGDLSESLIKRDLGVKDMSSVLPGHGGMMDRLDSLLLSAPVAFVLLGMFVPA